MQSRLDAYLSFGSEAREAMEFYRSIFGGKLDMRTFGEFNASSDPAEREKIMHSELKADNGISFMASDTPAGMETPTGSGIRLALSGDDEKELSEYFRKLSAGGTVLEPLAKAPWGDSFGMLADRYGVVWMVNIAGKQAR